VSIWLRKLPHHTHEHGASSPVACGGVNDAAAVVAGGAIGTLARAGLAEALPVHPGSFPWATFAANILGALILGWVVVARQHWRPLAGTGFLGGYSTFSTWMVERTYVIASIVAGLAVATLGYALGWLV
jgi:fluoride exporter